MSDNSEFGFYTAYAALSVMALVPIYVGSRMSVDYLAKAKASADKPEIMTSSDAKQFPLYASGALISLYLLFKVFGKEYVNLLLGTYFFVLGVLSLTETIRVFCGRFFPRQLLIPSWRVNLAVTKSDEPKPEDSASTEPSAAAASDDAAVASTKSDAQESWLDLHLDRVDFVCLAIAVAVGVWYLYSKHWVANNLFALSFCVSAVERLPIGSFAIGATLLAGLFVYDIFWVFGTDVMVTVATSFDAPIKVLFPKDFWEHGLLASKHAMLGLGDIVIPGIFIALLLRFDRTRSPNGMAYFLATFVAYIVGLATTIFVMHTFKAAQPALLYLVPTCVLTPLALSAVRGETKELFSYSDEPEPEQSESVEIEPEDKKAK